MKPLSIALVATLLIACGAITPPALAASSATTVSSIYVPPIGGSFSVTASAPLPAGCAQFTGPNAQGGPNIVVIAKRSGKPDQNGSGYDMAFDVVQIVQGHSSETMLGATITTVDCPA